MTDVVAENEDEDEKITTLEQFHARIARGVGDTTRPVGSLVSWFGPNGAPSFWKPREPVPFDKGSVIIAIFQSDDVVRVYTLPAKTPEPKPADWVERRPLRYTLTRVAPTYVTEEMDLQMMADELIDEHVQVVTGMNSADAELERVIEMVELMDPVPGGANVIDRAELLEALEARDHREFDPDEEDEPSPPSGEQVSPVSPVGSTMPAPASVPAEKPS